MEGKQEKMKQKIKILVLTFIAFLSPSAPVDCCITTGVTALRGVGVRGELRQRSVGVDGANSALPLLPQRGGDGDGVAGVLLSLPWRGGGVDGVSRRAPSARLARR